LEKWFEDRGLRLDVIWDTETDKDSGKDFKEADTGKGQATSADTGTKTGDDKGTDLFDLPLFPVIDSTETAGELIKWMISPA
jgi:hypothetical protein